VINLRGESMSDEETMSSMSCGAENRSRCPLLDPSVPLRPRRDAPSLLLSAFSIELEARIGLRLRSAVPPCDENETLRSRQNQRSASVNLPNILPTPCRFFLRGANLSSRDPLGRKKQREFELGPSFGPFLTTKMEFSYAALQTVNLLTSCL
jgi:hypothetical protein